MKPPIEIDEKVLAGEQPTGDDLADLAGRGVTLVVNLRRAGESNQSLTPDAEGEQAKALGLRYVHLPVSVGDLRPEQVAAFKDAVAGSKGRVYVHCGAGQRACAFALMRKADNLAIDADSLFAEAKEKGVALPDRAVVDFITSYVDGQRKK